MMLKFVAQHPKQFIQLILAFLWVYQGLLPKLLFPSAFDIQVWQFLGLEAHPATLFTRLSGCGEILFGCAFLFWQRNHYLHYLSIFGLLGLLILSAIINPDQLIAGFNPVIMNSAMAALSLLALQTYNPESTKPLNASLHEYNKMDSSV
ncbi:hypothetical protein F975_02646 [Acinetobacter sp. ANC 3789]|uniref:DoxX-like family protein n=1 Tax=Acinetobacter sp. ANC 3789 TaxID=1217714 RepID=UPI0002CD6EA1|nr:DoxX-like family protein [Acinetobacter sp. ANC 3789]ENU79402.1 hypothetical protein F975_02646 [Acinetobacter sp. ANC 3789]